MNYSLGNMLGGAGALNADKLALNLQFATDKTLTARKGPTPVFTRASTATFVGSNGLIQSAAINTARFDHDPITLACKGLLIEESRTNSILQSEAFSSTSWANGVVTRTADQIAAPSGATTADLITSVTGNFGGKLAQNFTFATTTYTASVFVKKGNWRYIGIQLADVSSSAVIPSFDFDTETVSQNGTSYATIGFQKYGNGWYRITLTQAVTAISSTFAIWMTESNGNVTGPIGAGNTVYTWGAQLEAGSFPTSYIPTTTASVVRSADICSISGSDFTGIYNATEGTLLVSADEFRRGTSFGSILRIADSVLPTNNRYSIGAFGSKTGVASPLEFIVASAAITQYTATPTSTTSNFKAALAYKVDDMRGAVNGVLATADTPPSTLIVTANTINIGGVGIHIASVRYFRKRLPNAKLVILST